MKTKLLMLGLLVALAGCQSEASKKEIADLTARVTANEKAAADAMAAARAAQNGNAQGIAAVSRAVLDAWDGLLGLFALSIVMLAVVNGLAFWLMGRALAPFPVIAAGLERIQSGDLAHRLPPLPGHEASTMGAAFNRMAQAVQDKVLAERKARDAEHRLEERRVSSDEGTELDARSGSR